MHPIYFAVDLLGKIIAALRGRYFLLSQIKQKLQYPVRILEFLVGAGGFEPPKLKAADLQSVPIGHSGTRPYSFSQSRGLPVYVTTENAVCQPIIWAEGKNIYNNHKSPPVRIRFAASGQEGFSA